MNRSESIFNNMFRQFKIRKLADFAPMAALIIILAIIPFFVNDYIKAVLIKLFIYSLFALSLNILWGYTGLFSLGHAVFFGVAGYVAGILTVHTGINSFWLIALAGVLAATILAPILGVLALRVSGIYFLLVTLAMGELFSSLALKLRDITGGSQGTRNILLPNLGIPFSDNNQITLYFLAFIALIACFYLILRFIRSPFGHTLEGIRENEPRMTALGYNVWLYKYISYIVAAAFAGVAGVLFAYYSTVMAPVHLAATTSTEAMLMVIVGSCTIIWGPILGAGFVVILEQVSSIYAPERWPLILGGVFVIAVMFIPGGLGVYFADLWKRIRHGSVKN